MTIRNLASAKLDDNQQKNQSAFLCTQIITAQCHAIINTVFESPEKKPEWFDGLKAKLDDAKQVASEWIDELGPAVSASIPISVVRYGTTFNASIVTINNLFEQNQDYRKKHDKEHDKERGKDDPSIVDSVSQIMQNLAGSVDVIKKKVDKKQQQLSDWGEKMQKAHDALKGGAQSIQDTIADLKSDITKMDAAVKHQHELIDGYNKAIAYSAMAIGVGIFLCVAGVALAIATAGTAAIVASGVAVVGAAGIVSGAATWGIMQKKIDEAYDTINDDLKEKASDQQQIISLKVLAAASDSAVTSMEQSTAALSDFRVTWKGFGDELKDVCDKLKEGADMKSVIMEKVMAMSAEGEWDKTVELAQNLLSAKVTIEHKKIDVVDKAAA